MSSGDGHSPRAPGARRRVLGEVACLLGLAALLTLTPTASGAIPLGTTITFTGRSSATEVVNGLATFSTSMTWRETAKFYARDNLAPEGFHVAFTTVTGTGTATILPRPDDPSGYKLPICAGGRVEPVPITQRVSPLEVTSPRRPSRVQIRQLGIGAARGYDARPPRTRALTSRRPGAGG